jgi:hypothetical protein
VKRTVLAFAAAMALAGAANAGEPVPVLMAQAQVDVPGINTPAAPAAPPAVPGFSGTPTEAEKKPDPNAPVFGKPLYNPESKSYFELFKPNLAEMERAGANVGRTDIVDMNWESAKTFAQSRAFHGVRGRLAVVKTDETHKFIAKNLHPPDGTWIGLRLMCSGRTLQWVTGEIWPLNAYANWGQPWNRNGGTPEVRSRADCSMNIDYLPVHYWGPTGGYRWNANGAAKRFYYLIIEYPTGKP